MGLGLAAAERRAGAEDSPYSAGPGFVRTAGGLMYEDLRLGEGAEVHVGDRVALDWQAFTVHRGFVVQARRLSKGGAFEAEENDLLRLTLGDEAYIGALAEGVEGMRAGGIRRLLVRPGKFYWPADGSGKSSFARVGPAPATFSGRRALDQVLTNVTGTIDKTIVLDVEVLERGGGGAYRRGPGRVVDRGAAVSTNTEWSALGGSRRQAGGLYAGT